MHAGTATDRRRTFLLAGLVAAAHALFEFPLVAAALTVGVHAVVVAAVVLLPEAMPPRTYSSIEIEVLKKEPEPPPPPDPALKEPEPPPPPEPKPAFVPEPPKPAAPLAKPPADEPPPPPDAPPPPVFFGIVPGATEGAGSVEVPMGDSLTVDPAVTTDDASKLGKARPAEGESGGKGTAAPATAAPDPDKPVSPAEVTRWPKLKREVRAPYPAEAKELGVEGIVVLKIHVGADGSVKDVKVVTGLGHGLDEAAVKAVKEFLFDPAMKGDKPVSTIIPRYEYEFILD